MSDHSKASIDAVPTHDSPKRHGDAVHVVGPAPKEDEAVLTGDSPKRQGDPLQHAVDEAAGLKRAKS